MFGGWLRKCVVAVLAFTSAVGACRCSCTCNDTCPAIETAPAPPTSMLPKPVEPAKVPEQYRFIYNLHNAYRKRHGVRVLAWSPRVASSAEAWARNCEFKHQSQSRYGENLYAVWGMPNIARALSNAAAAWYDEVSAYSYDNPGFSMKTGHFTQVVWKNSRRLGCAARQCGSMTLVVCRYDPPGNVMGQFKANVPKRT